MRELENWKTKTDKDFLQLLKDYFVDAPMVVVKAKPSFDEYCKLSDEEKHVTNQIKKLGRKRLKQKGTKLQQSIKEKNVYFFTLIYIYMLRIISSIQIR